jgi:PTS system nitrogen regulatory IIA component
LTDVFFLICSYDDTVHLRILAKLSRMISSPQFLSELRASQSAADAWRAIDQAEEIIDQADEEE